jgi:hypothetical protein
VPRGALFLFVLLVATLPGSAGELDERVLSRHVRFLTAEELGSVRAGSRGLVLSARYLGAELARLGLLGGGPDGTLLVGRHAPFVSPDPRSTLAFVRGEERGSLAFGRGFLPYRFSAEGEVSAEVLVDLGHEPAVGAYRGRIVVLPEEPLGTGARDRAEAAAARGAVAVVFYPMWRPSLDEVEFTDGRIVRGEIREAPGGLRFLGLGSMEPAPLDLGTVREIRYDVPAGPSAETGWCLATGEPPAAVPVVSIGVAAARRILGRELLQAGVVSGLTLRIDVAHRREERNVPIIRARLPGTDETLRHRPVLLTARYDRDEGAGPSGAIALAVVSAIVRGGPPRRDVEVVLGTEFESQSPDRVAVRLVPGSAAILPEARRVLAEVRERAARAPGEPAAGELSRPEVRARLARYRGDHARALEAIGEALRAEPGRADLYLERGRIRLDAGDPEGALEDAANLAKLSLEDPRAQLLRAEIWFAGGRDREARAALDLAAAAGLPEATFHRALLRMTEADPAEGVRADLRSTSEKGAGTGLGELARGLLLLTRDHREAAVEAFSEAIATDPFLREAYLYRAEIRSELEQDLAGAVGDCDRALELGVTDPGLLFTRGLCFLRLRCYSLAILDFEAYVREGGGDQAAAVYNIACAHALMGNREAALEWLGRSVEAGFRDLGHARLDPDLALIREDPRFEKILRSSESD